MKYFKKVDLCPRTIPKGNDDDLFAGEEICDAQDLINTIEECICDEVGLSVCDFTIDTAGNDWLEEVQGRQCVLKSGGRTDLKIRMSGGIYLIK